MAVKKPKTVESVEEAPAREASTKPGPEGGSPKDPTNPELPLPDARGGSPKEVVSHQEQFAALSPSK